MATNIVLLVGIPGSGKSTYANTLLPLMCRQNERVAYCSRDVIRKELLGNNANDPNKYFTKEKEVFSTWVKQINDALVSNASMVIIDATHISKASRAKVLRRLDLRPHTTLEVCCMPHDLERALAFNQNREGFARVPDTAIQNMFNSFEFPTYEEFSDYGFETISIKEVT